MESNQVFPDTATPCLFLGGKGETGEAAMNEGEGLGTLQHRLALNGFRVSCRSLPACWGCRHMLLWVANKFFQEHGSH